MSSKQRNDAQTAKKPSTAEGEAGAAPVVTAVADASRGRKKVHIQAAWAAFIGGIRAHYAPTETFRMPGGTLSRDELAARLERFIESAETTKAKHREYLAAVQAERRAFAELRPTYDSAVSIVRGHHGKQSRTLLEFGIRPAKPRNVSPATLLVAAEKARATRLARGTMGKRQRANIRGVLPSTGAAAAILAALRPAVPVPVAPTRLPAPHVTPGIPPIPSPAMSAPRPIVPSVAPTVLLPPAASSSPHRRRCT